MSLDSCKIWFHSTLWMDVGGEDACRVCTVGWLNLKISFTSTGIPMIKIKQSHDCLIFIMWFPILVRWHPFIESAYWCVMWSVVHIQYLCGCKTFILESCQHLAACKLHINENKMCMYSFWISKFYFMLNCWNDMRHFFPKLDKKKLSWIRIASPNCVKTQTPPV